MFIVYSGSCGGAERVVSRLCDFLSARDFECSIVMFSQKNDFFKNEKVKILQLSINRKSKINKFFDSICKLRKTIKKEKPDTIVSFLDYQNICVILANRFLPSKLIVSERNDPMQRSRVIRFLCNYFYRFADKVVFQSQYSKECYSKVIQNKSVIISNPLPCDMTSIYHYKGFDSTTIITASRLDKQKNIPLLINSMIKLHQFHPNFKLKIFGTGPLYQEMSYLILQNKANEYISLEGFSNHVCEEMQNARLFVLSSNYEGVSNAMLEALAIGVPVISTKTKGGAISYIKDGDNGYLVECGDIDNLFQLMKYLIDNPLICERIHNNSIKINSVLSINIIGNQWINIL